LDLPWPPPSPPPPPFLSTPFFSGANPWFILSFATYSYPPSRSSPPPFSSCPPLPQTFLRRPLTHPDAFELLTTRFKLLPRDFPHISYFFFFFPPMTLPSHLLILYRFLVTSCLGILSQGLFFSSSPRGGPSEEVFFRRFPPCNLVILLSRGTHGSPHYACSA